MDNASHPVSTKVGRYQQTYPRFSLIRRYETLFQLLDDQAALVLHAPAGSGKRRAVRQWLHVRGHDYQIWKWRSGDALGGLKERLSEASRQVGTHCLVIDVGAQQLTRAEWLCLSTVFAETKSAAGVTRRIIVLTALYPAVASDCMADKLYYRYAFADLAFTTDELATLFELLPESCRLGNTSEQLYTLSGGWPALVTDILDAPIETSMSTLHSEERLRRLVAVWLDQANQRLDQPQYTVLWLLAALGALPGTLFGAEENGLDLGIALVALQTAGLVTCSHAASDMVSLNPGSPAALILDAEAFSPENQVLEHCAEWLVGHDYQSIAIEAYLRLKDWESLEALLLHTADALVARLQVHDLRRWISMLDDARQVRHPVILICAIRCAVYQGSDLEIRRYFQRIVDQLRETSPDALRACMSEARWSRFLAEIQLYSDLTQQGVMLCREWANQAGRAVQTSPVALLQEAFGLAQAGEIAKLVPIVVSGLEQSEALKSWALHLTFSIFNFWMLILSCRCRQAETFLAELRAKLIANKVALASAYDWLDMLALLLDRMKGSMQLVEARIESLQRQPRVEQDVLKNNLLVTLRADMLLMRGDSYLVHQGLHELAALQSSCTPRSYWFASAATMREALLVLEGEADADLTHLPPADQLQLEHLGLQAQTGLLWRIKSRLHRLPEATLFPHLDRFQAHLMRTGQWLRSLEVDVLRAVCLHRSQRESEGQLLFARVAGHLQTESLLGALADPFLLWRPLVQDSLDASLRHSLTRLLAWRDGCSGIAVADPVPDRLAEELTGREKQVLRLLADGSTNQAIADQLNLSITTVRTHVQNIYRKLDVNNRAAATAYACRMNLV